MKFRVRDEGIQRIVEFRFANQSDLDILRLWAPNKKQANNEFVRDALEYSAHASQRWPVYQRLGRTVVSCEELQEISKRDKFSEIVFLLVSEARWHKPSPILGFCFCRRTWCHHVILDFAACHPNAIRKAGGKVNGVGSAMLYSLVKVSNDIGIKCVWGEATLNSFRFYQASLNIKRVPDYFFIRGKILKYCLEQHKLVNAE